METHSWFSVICRQRCRIGYLWAIHLDKLLWSLWIELDGVLLRCSLTKPTNPPSNFSTRKPSVLGSHARLVNAGFIWIRIPAPRCGSPTQGPARTRRFAANQLIELFTRYWIS
ncbi:hypothetical protein RSAG8_09223, partial [Rhizoctonia solani AG-8 WAC10335]